MRKYLSLWHLAVWSVLAVVLSPSTWLIGAEISLTSTSGAAAQTRFELQVRENRLSLKAEDASVAAILDTIGRHMQIDMVVRLREDWPVTTAFSALSLQDALKRLGVSAATMVEEDQQGAAVVTKVVVLDKGRTTGLSSSAPNKPSVGAAEHHTKRHLPRERGAASFKFEVAPTTTMTDAAPLKLTVDPSKAERQP